MIESRALSAARAFAPRAWERCWAALALTTVASAVALAGANIAWIPAVLLLVMARGALWRMALAIGRPGPGGLQAGALELRILATALLALLFLGILALLLTTFLLCLTFALATAGPGFDVAEPASWAAAIPAAGRAILTVATVLCGLALAFAASRISLAEAASVTTGKVQLLSTWPRTRRRALSILLANVVAALPVLGAGFLYWTPWRVAAPFALAVTGAVVWLPLQVGLMAYVFQDSSAPER